MAKMLRAVTAVLLAVSLLLTLACLLWPVGMLLTLTISFGTTAYHFAMRLAVGWAANRLMRSRPDPDRRRFRPRSWEAPLYAALQVRRWKAHVPTYDPTVFDPKLHTWREIAQATCQAETVHLLCAAFSLVPLAFIVPFGQPAVFILTSVLAALLDLCFVIVQRFNRPMLLRLAQREARRSHCPCDPAESFPH